MGLAAGGDAATSAAAQDEEEEQETEDESIVHHCASVGDVEVCFYISRVLCFIIFLLRILQFRHENKGNDLLILTESETFPSMEFSVSSLFWVR